MRRVQGLSLIEVLITLAVGMSGLLAMAGFQASLQRAGGLGKQRAEATLRAQQWIEATRAFEVIKTQAGKAAFQDIVAISTPLSITGRTTSYSLTATVDNYRYDKAAGTLVLDNASAEPPALKRIGVRLGWRDPTGQDATVGLTTQVAGTDPRTGASAFRPPPSASFNRNAGVPATAADLGNGTSSYQPGGPGSTNPVLVYSNFSGRVISVGSQTLPAGSYSVMGYITGWSYTSYPPITPMGSVGATMVLSGYPAAPDAALFGCWSDRAAPQIAQTISYVCVMPPAQQPGSSVRVLLTGLVLALSSTGDMVCQFSATSSPYTGEALKRSYTNENYWVQRGNWSACPSAAPTRIQP